MKMIRLLAFALITSCLSPLSHGDSTVSPEHPRQNLSANGLVTIDTKDGSGPSAQRGNEIVVHYTGWLYDPTAPHNKGQEFDSSRDRGQPFNFTLGTGSVIKGWDQGLVGMKVGGQRTLIIPPELGYGSRGAGQSIPPDSTLIFDVEMLEIH